MVGSTDTINEEVSEPSAGSRTSAAILEAARCQFTETSFDGTGLRAIADRAGVNVALISRYFGSKEGLFLAAVPPRIDMRYLLAGPMQDFGERAAGIMEMKVVRGFDPVVALIRAAASPACGPAIRGALDSQVIAPLAMRLDGPDAEIRAGLIVAQMTGYDLMVRVLGVAALTSPAGGARRDLLANILQQLVDGTPSPPR
ncbi:MAG: TetR family transcriptional regulator [Bacteroidetes bacterium]|nr:TetR family transcriptional regulator [Bacteroidota bacterium]